ncbi:MAG: aminotransferase class I/II-fold pyridoxal phosphate-dependent enzyme [Sphingomonas sp.]
MQPLFHHGGRLDDAARAFPQAPRPWLDLSTGINPFAWDGPAPAVDQRALPAATALAALETAAAAAFGLAAGGIAALPGSEIALRLLACIGLPAPFHVVAPGYRTHAAALPGARAVSADALEAAAEGGGTLLIANPNNPDGRLIPPDRLLALAARLAAQGGLLVVDEAFADATPGASLLPWLAGGEAVVVLRSFGKFYGLAGVRLGFACGAAGPVARLADLAGSWPVSACALAIGTAAYADAAWADAMRHRLVRAAAALDDLLRAHGLSPTGASPLFRLVETPEAGALFARLAAAGILARPFDYAPRWLRLGLPDGPAALDRLDRALGHR